MIRRVIFLDIDGVLNSERWYSQSNKDIAIDKYGNAFDPEAVANLEKIVAATGADIVISSSWKFLGISVMQDMWHDRDLPGKVIDVTPTVINDEMLQHANLEDIDALPKVKGYEIKEWLRQHGKNVSSYVIIDDMDDMLPEQQEHFVQTMPNVGLSKCDAEVAIRILNMIG